MHATGGIRTVPELRSYIVRVYRVDQSGPSGTVEDLTSGASRSFHTSDELWAAVAGEPELVRPSTSQRRKSRTGK